MIWFTPVGADNGDIKFYYADDAGLQKAKFMSFSLGINPDYEYTEKRHILVSITRLPIFKFILPS